MAIVTGASRGIGKAISSAFALEGASVAACARNRDELERVAEGIGPGVLSSMCDVTSEAEVGRFVHEVSQAFR